MRLLRLTLTDFRNYAALTWRPRGADQRAGRPQRQRQDQPAGGGLPAGARPRPAQRAQRRPAAAGRRRRLGRRRPLRHARRARPISAPARRRTGPPDRRVFRLDGATPRSQAEIAAHVAAVWLTPQMDRLFLEGAVRPPPLPRPAGLGAGARRMRARSPRTTPRWRSRNRLLAEGRAGPGLARRAGGRHGPPRRRRHRRAHGAGGPAERRAGRRRHRRLPAGAASPWPARSPTAWPRHRRWRWRTGCAPASPPTARATPPPAPPRSARTAPTCG